MLGVLAAAVLTGPRPAAAVLSYAVAAQDAPGSSTGAAVQALGVPDYFFVNDTDLGFGGDNVDVFAPGESTVLVFPAPLRNVAGQPDLLVSAYVGGGSATDNADVEVEVSSDGTTFTPVAGFSTEDGRDPFYLGLPAEAGFASVKHFPIEFGSADLVTHVRLRNAAGTAEGLRLDAVEGLQPATQADHAFEIRFEQYRDVIEVGRFLVRIKNLARAGGAPIRELRIVKPPDPIRLEDTRDVSLHAQLGQPGELFCFEYCIPDGTQSDPQLPIPYSRHVWSLDGTTVAPAGTGLGPGRQAAHRRYENFDTDFAATLLAGFSIEVTFADGAIESFDFDGDVIGSGEVGALYQKYNYFNGTLFVNGPQPAYFYELVPEPTTASGALAATAALLMLRRTRSASPQPKQ